VKKELDRLLCDVRYRQGVDAGARPMIAESRPAISA
jgi:hypothetical protein